MTCSTGKASTTHKAAKEIAKRMRRSQDKARVTPYQCRECGKWHIGEDHRPKSITRGKRT